MQPYGVRVIEYPDVADIHSMGSKSSVGKIRKHNEFVGYCKNPSKAKTRRYWKKARQIGKRMCREEEW